MKHLTRNMKFRMKLIVTGIKEMTLVSLTIKFHTPGEKKTQEKFDHVF